MHPYAALTPEVVLDALSALGLRPDGRLLALSSYENRVYQIWLEEDPPVVVKFYRPDRWSEAQIDEEHAFAHELAEREIPVVAPQSSSSFGGFRLAVYPAPRRAHARARAIRKRWNGSAASWAASMPSARPGSSRTGESLDAARPSAMSRAPTCSRRLHSRRPARSLESRHRAGIAAAWSACYARRRDGEGHPPARRLPSGKHPVDRRRAALRRPRRLAHGTGDAGPVDAALRRPRGDVAAAARGARRLRAIHANSIEAS